MYNIPLVDLTSDNSDEEVDVEDYEQVLTALNLTRKDPGTRNLACGNVIKEEHEEMGVDIDSSARTGRSNCSKRISPSHALAPISSPHVIIMAESFSNDEISLQTSRRKSDSDEDGGRAGLDGEFDTLSDSDSDRNHEYEDQFIRITTPPPPILSPPIFPVVVDNQQPCTSSSVGKYLIMPSLREFVDTPTTSPSFTPRRGNENEAASRAKLTSEQSDALTASFRKNRYAIAMEVMELSDVTGLTKFQIQRWFNAQRRIMRRHEQVKEQKSAWKKSQSDPIATTSNTFQGNSSKSKDDSPVSPKRQRHSDPSRPTPNRVPHTTRDREDNPVTITIDNALSRAEKIQKRMDGIKELPIKRLMEELQNCKGRVLNLAILYMKQNLGMRRRLLTETARLNEMSTKISPFSPQQQHSMTAWQQRYFRDLRDQHQSGEKISQLSFVQKQIVEVWHPKIIYGKLAGLSLENAIKDFTYNSARQINMEYSIPGMLRYDDLIKFLGNTR